MSDPASEAPNSPRMSRHLRQWPRWGAVVGVVLGLMTFAARTLSARRVDPRLMTSVFAAKVTYRATRLVGRSGGTALPGVIAERVDPAIIAKVARALPRGTIVVAGTNGKTTTSRLLTEMLAAGGYRPVNNGAGSNLSRGIAAAFTRVASPLGRVRADTAVLETDEAAFPAIVAAVQPRMIVLNNLFRDQLDRYGELNSVANRWAAAIATLPPATVLVYDADDPTLCTLADGAPDGITRVPFGLGAHRYGLPMLAHAADSIHCPRCGTPLRYHTLSVGHLGDWYCPTGDAARPPLDFTAAAIALDGMDGAAFRVESAIGVRRSAVMNQSVEEGTGYVLPVTADRRTPIADYQIETRLPGLYNVYNALGAFAAAITCGVAPETAIAAARTFVPPFGRIERVTLHGRRLTLLLIKNPTGANEVLRLLTAAPPAPLLIAINDLIADGRDVSWLWDTDFESLAEYSGPIIVSGIRAADMAVRLKYAGVPAEQIAIVPDIPEALTRIAERAASGGDAYVLPTYTAMLAARDALARFGALADVWASAERVSTQ